MLSHCANSKCCKPFLKLREGKLFLVEKDGSSKVGEYPSGFVRNRQQTRQVEHFWLCDECAAKWSLVYDRERGIGLLPLRRPAGSASAAAAAHNGVA